MPSLDKCSPAVFEANLATVSNGSKIQTGSLAKLLRFKMSSRLMLRTTVSVDNRLVTE